MYEHDIEPEWVEGVKRRFGVFAERLRSDVQQVAAGQQVLCGETDTLRAGMGSEFKEVKALVRLSYAELERRVVSLESEIGTLHSRVSRLESRLPA